MKDLIDIYQNEILLEELISSSVNFQNYESVNRIFSTIFDLDFSDELLKENFISGKKEKIDFTVSHEMLNSLTSIIELRHKLVHDMDLSIEISKKDVESYYVNTLVLITAIDKLIDKHIKNHLKDEFR